MIAEGRYMFNLFKKIMPREERFFDLFEKHAACLTAGSLTLRKLLDGGPDIAMNCKILMGQEEQADAIGHEVLQAIRRTFITPFDRGDIQGLITAMDDAIDQMNKTAKAVLLFDVRKFTPEMRLMGDQIVQAATLTAEAIPLLRRMNPNSNRLIVLTTKIAELEEASDHVHDDGLRTLLGAEGRKDPMAFIIGSEIYSHLEKVSDRFEDVANTVSGIVIEHM
jgi:predicted phosphate transport protein (TIGR00153 family)